MTIISASDASASENVFAMMRRTEVEVLKNIISPKLATFDVQFGFEKMQSFSGAISQLNIWSKKLSTSQMRALSQCSGRREKTFPEREKIIDEILMFM